MCAIAGNSSREYPMLSLNEPGLVILPFGMCRCVGVVIVVFMDYHLYHEYTPVLCVCEFLCMLE